jgi:hypothetical protein
MMVSGIALTQSVLYDFADVNVIRFCLENSQIDYHPAYAKIPPKIVHSEPYKLPTDMTSSTALLIQYTVQKNLE